jgi:hypothetical protein
MGAGRIYVVSMVRLIAGSIAWSLDQEVRKHEPTVVP